MRGRRVGRSSVVLLACLVAACRGGSPDSAPTIVGFVLVGAADDLGYNEAVATAAGDVARAHPELDIRLVEDVPETEAAGEAMQALVDDGAALVFATSFGYRAEAEAVAAANPGVVVVHQGGLESDSKLDNFGTYWGAHHEILYAAGLAAAEVSTSGVVGFVVAFRIPTTYVNVDALTLGARSVRPDLEVVVTYTDDWCDPGAQLAALDRVVAAGADVVALHQDCTQVLLESAEERGIGVIGYHADGSEVAPRNWLTGSVWTWGDLYIDIVETVLAGSFADSPYNGDHRGSLAGGDNPAVLTEPGPRVSDATGAAMQALLADFAAGTRHAFVGPITDSTGAVRVPSGEVLDAAAVDALDYFVAGVREV